MSVNKSKVSEFEEKMARAKAIAPAAPSKLVLVEGLAAPSKKMAETFPQKTLSAKLAEADYDKIEEVILARKKAGERSLTNKQAAREMVALWLRHYGVEPFDYDATK